MWLLFGSVVVVGGVAAAHVTRVGADDVVSRSVQYSVHAACTVWVNMQHEYESY